MVCGRNLPVKEFCYLRTVNLTAAVWWRVRAKVGELGREVSEVSMRRCKEIRYTN